MQKTEMHPPSSTGPPGPERKRAGSREETGTPNLINPKYPDSVVAHLLVECNAALRLACAALSRSELEEWLQTEHGRALRRQIRKEVRR